MPDGTSFIEPAPTSSMDTDEPAQPGADTSASVHDDFVRTVFGTDPASYAAADAAGPEAALQSDDPTAECPSSAPETPEPAGGTPAPCDPDMDPNTGAPQVDPPRAEDPDDGGSASEPGDDPPKAPLPDDPDPDPEANVGRGTGSGEAVPDEAPMKAGERVLLGMPQREQAADNMAKMSPEEHAQVQALLDVAASHSADEVEYVAKAIAAGHTVAELKAFQQQIAGKDAAWMDANLRLVGGSSGKGIKQQWSHSCASTEVEAMKGELDPIYAFQLRQKNPKLDQADDKDGNALNPDLANEQFRLLTETGGTAVPRGDAEHGHGGKMSTVLNSEAAGMGLTFDRNDVGQDVTMDEALATAQQRLKTGMPVPICVGDDANPFAHAAMMTAVEDGPPRRFYIHDPWTGSVKGYSEADIRDGKLDVGSCKKLAAIYPPHRK